MSDINEFCEIKRNMESLIDRRRKWYRQETSIDYLIQDTITLLFSVVSFLETDRLRNELWKKFGGRTINEELKNEIVEFVLSILNSWSDGES